MIFHTFAQDIYISPPIANFFSLSVLSLHPTLTPHLPIPQSHLFVPPFTSTSCHSFSSAFPPPSLPPALLPSLLLLRLMTSRSQSRPLFEDNVGEESEVTEGDLISF